MINKTFSVIIGLTLLLMFTTVTCSKEKQGDKTTKSSYDDNESGRKIGLRSSSLFDEETVNRTPAEFSKDSPGVSQPIERSFNNAPPLIPHSIKGFVPITKKNNTCLNCHMPKLAEQIGATPLPKSHLYDTRANKDLRGKLSQSRYVCLTCHVEQATNLKPLVNNEFTPGFSSEKMKTSSDLIK